MKAFLLSGKKDIAQKKFQVSLSDLTFYIGMLISVPHIKEHLKGAKWKRDLADYNNAIYHYSHKKMLKLSKNKIFQFLFEDFIVSGEYERFTNLQS